jgi:thymidylate synthase
MARPRHQEYVYLELLEDILKNGMSSGDRTGTGTRKVYGRMLKFDLQKGFPLLTTKKTWFKGILVELLWLISGDTNIRPLVKEGVHIWNEWPFQNYLKSRSIKLTPNTPEWNKEIEIFTEKIISDDKFAKKFGDLGPVYGKQWRAWEGDNGAVDQLQNAIDKIKSDPGDRRIIVNAWRVDKVDQMALPPCHLMYQFGVLDKKLHMSMYMRSVDTFLGLPFNIASYALLLHMVAQLTNLKPGELTLFLWDTHLYKNHLKQARQQLKRKPYKLPEIKIKRKVKNIDDFKFDDFVLLNYQSHPAIKAEISV